MTKKQYESYIIIDGNLDDNAIEEEIKKYENLLTKNEVEIKEVVRIGRRRLAYPILKRLNGFYVCFDILASTNLVTKLERTYKLDDSILRYLTIHVSARTKKEKEEHFKNKALMQSKFEEAKEKQENSSPKENTNAEPQEELVKETT